MKTFSSKNQPTPCKACGKLTTTVVGGRIGLDLCGKCMHACDMENEHADGMHAERFVKGCAECAAAGAKKVEIAYTNAKGRPGRRITTEGNLAAVCAKIEESGGQIHAYARDFGGAS